MKFVKIYSIKAGMYLIKEIETYKKNKISLWNLKILFKIYKSFLLQKINLLSLYSMLNN